MNKSSKKPTKKQKSKRKLDKSAKYQKERIEKSLKYTKIRSSVDSLLELHKIQGTLLHHLKKQL